MGRWPHHSEQKRKRIFLASSESLFCSGAGDDMSIEYCQLEGADAVVAGRKMRANADAPCSWLQHKVGGGFCGTG